jgi:fatty-acyl-CoA synthase
VVDDVLLPLLAQFQGQCAFEKIIVFPFSGTPVAAPFLNYETLLDQANGDKFQYVAHHEDDAVSMCYTSGTTGKPKGVVYSHRSTILHTLVGCTADIWALRSSDVVFPVTPMFHANSWGMPYGAVMTGCKLVFPGPHLHPDDLLDLMQLEPPTLSLGVPTIWMSLIQTYEASLDKQPGRWKLPAGMRSLVGGAAVPEALIRAFDKHGIWIQQGWGMTETSPLATVSYTKSEFIHADADERYRRAAMAGVPVPLVDIRMRGDDGHDAPWDGQAVGEIQVRGPFITGSYHEVPVSEDKFSADGWLRTGDVASMDAHGFVRITDRTKDLIKSGGEWISSVDLENALMGHGDVAEAAVIAIPDPKWSERPLACVVAKPGKALDFAALSAHLLANGFAKWQLPERYESIAAVPRTSTGKFYKLKLREMFPA